MFLLILKQLSPALFCCVSSKCQTKRSMCKLIRQSDCSQYMGRSADEDAQAEPDDAQIPCASSIIRRELPSTYSNEKFALPGRRFGDCHLTDKWNFMQYSLNQIIAKGNFVTHCGAHLIKCDFCCHAKACNCRYIFCASANATFLPSAKYKWCQCNAIADIQKTDALWSINFMCTGT